MTTTNKKPALSTQLKNAKKEIEALTEQLKKSQESQKRAESNAEYREKERRELANEVEQLHQFFDALPNSIPRKVQHENGYSTTENAAMTRLCAWLACK